MLKDGGVRKKQVKDLSLEISPNCQISSISPWYCNTTGRQMLPKAVSIQTIQYISGQSKQPELC